jgi:hypothetical protein
MLEQVESTYLAMKQELGRVMEIVEPEKPIVLNYYATISDYEKYMPENYKRAGWADQRSYRNSNQIHVRKEGDKDDPVDPITDIRGEIAGFFLGEPIKGVSITTTANYWALNGFISLFEIGAEKIYENLYAISRTNKAWLDYYKEMTNDRFKSLDKLIKESTTTRDTQAQGWGLSHYLFNAENGRHRYNFLKLVGKICKGGSEEDDFEKILKIKPTEQFQQQVIKYIKALR